MSFDFIACQTFAGGFDMGATQSGGRMIHKLEQNGGFGIPNVLANRHLLGEQWDWQACPPEQWEVMPAHVVTGNPPCSGFSLMSAKHFRGVDSPVNACMWAFVEYAARVRPYIAIFESVQQAYTGGLDLMQALHRRMEELTGWQWHLYHILHNNIGVGGSAIRKRYFWCVSRIPFGVDPPSVDRVPSVMDVIGDLTGLADTWHTQPYRRPPTWWSESRRSMNDVVDGHWSLKHVSNKRALELLHAVGWGEKEIISEVTKRYYEEYGCLPPSWRQEQLPKLLASNWAMGFHQSNRWPQHRVCRVITGGAMGHVIHPTEPRFITHRETARIMGFPDDWRIAPLRGQGNLAATWGKGIPVDVGRWIGSWIDRALHGEPSDYTGSLTGEREHVLQFTDTYRTVCNER